MKNILLSTLWACLVIGFTSCDQDVPLPNQFELYNGFFVDGSATPWEGLNTNAGMVKNGDSFAKILRLSDGELGFVLHDNTTKGNVNAQIFGTNAEDEFVIDGETKPVTAGIYKVEVNKVNGTTSINKINSWGIVGTATPGGWDSDTDMALVSEENGVLVYEITIDLIGEQECKFRANDGWGINLGGPTNGLEHDHKNNYVVEESGRYKVQLILGSTFTCVYEKL